MERCTFEITSRICKKLLKLQRRMNSTEREDNNGKVRCINTNLNNAAISLLVTNLTSSSQSQLELGVYLPPGESDFELFIMAAIWGAKENLHTKYIFFAQSKRICGCCSEALEHSQHSFVFASHRHKSRKKRLTRSRLPLWVQNPVANHKYL